MSDLMKGVYYWTAKGSTTFCHNIQDCMVYRTTCGLAFEPVCILNVKTNDISDFIKRYTNE